MRKAFFVLHLCLFVLLSNLFPQSLKFNGSNTYVSLGNAAPLHLTSFTLEAWIRTEGSGGFALSGQGGIMAVPIIAKGRGEMDVPSNLNMNYFLGLDKSRKLVADFEEAAGPNHPVISTAVVADKTWTHVAVTYEPVNAVWKLYINGKLDATKDLGSNIVPATISIQPAAIAAALNSKNVPAGWFKGKIDEVRIWNIARTDADILNNYKKELTSGTGLVARYGLNEGTGSTTANQISSASNGILYNAPAWTNGFNQTNAINFNGGSNYISFGAADGSNGAPSLNLTRFTLEAWIRPEGKGVNTNTGTNGLIAVPIIAKGRGESDVSTNLNMNYLLGIDGNKKLVADFEEASGGNHPVIGTTAIKDSVWTHVAASYDPVSAVWKLYINGKLDATKDLGSNITPVSTSIQQAGIASALSSTGRPSGYFKGKIDEVRIWNLVRSDADILNNYKNELTSGTGLVARWPLEEVSGTAIPNAVAGGVSGKFFGSGPVWTTGFTVTSAPPPPPPPITGGFSTVNVSSGWDEAVGLTFNKTGDEMFVWERAGKIWVVKGGQKKLFLDISPEVGAYRDLGLLGFALHPQFDKNGYFYLLYTVDRHHLLYYGTSKYSPTANEYNNATIGRLTRYTAKKTSTGYSVDTLTRKILIGATKTTGIPVTYVMHHVGSLVFGTDETLLVSAGDGSTASQADTGSVGETFYEQALKDGIITPQQNVGAFRAQLLQSYNGKILRIDPETGNGISSNPFYESASPGSIRSKVWALGFRTPFRMSLKPGTGSHNPADGNPGVIYEGDVGFNTWEEINIIDKGGMNFGWPLFEGLTPQPLYSVKRVYNYYAPNPLYGVNGCNQQYFYFSDLIKQATASGKVSFTNPCNAAQAIPSGIKTFIHNRPAIDWKQPSGPSRTGIYSGETATEINIGAPGSPVAGPQFGGACVVGGVFYTHDDFPAEYRNTYFFGDYVSRWIRNMVVDANNKPVAVKSPVDNNRIVVAFAVNPVETGLYYVDFGSDIRKIVYNVSNHVPVAVASSDKKYGVSPLFVQFNGSASYDADNEALTYSWNFGDGTTSTAVNPTHTFTAATKAPTTYTIRLIVTDIKGSRDSTTVLVSLNNTPPSVTITSPADSTLYPMTGETTYNLRATVTDKEHTSSQLFYQWQTILHHEEHEHPDAIDTARATTTIISPLGCGSETYYYRVTLTVTDAGGLATTKEVRLYPDCGKKAVTANNNLKNSIAIASDLETKESINAPASIAYYPNPFKHQFTLQVYSKSEGKLPVKLYDIHGQAVLQLEDIQVGQTLVLGKELPSGTYVMEVGKGNASKRYKLIKIQ